MNQKMAYGERVGNSLCFNVEKGMERLREIGILECIFHLMTAHLHWEDPEDRSSVTIVRN